MYNVSSSSTSPLKLWQIKKFNLEEVPSHYFHVVFLSEFPVVEHSLSDLWVAASMCFLRPDATLLQKNKRSSWNSSECHLFEDQYEHRAGRFGLVLHQTSILIQLEVEGGHILHHLIWVGICGRILHWISMKYKWLVIYLLAVRYSNIVASVFQFIYVCITTLTEF